MSIFKKIILCSLLLPCSLSLVGKVYYREGYEKKEIDRKNTDIASDIHDVLVKKDKKEMERIKNEDIGWNGYFNTLNPWFIYYSYTIKRDNPDIEWQDLIIELTNYIPRLKAYLPIIFRIDNARLPIDGMPEIIKTLAEQGFTLRPLSNIHRNSFNGWYSDEVDAYAKPVTEVQGLKNKLPELFNYFKEGVVEAKKPQAYGYKLFLDTYNNDRSRTTIFLDDKKENVDAALQNGIDIGITFDKKDIEQFKKDLLELGITV